MAITAISGRAGRVSIAGVLWNFDDCNVKFMMTLGESTGFEDQQGDGSTTVNRASGLQDFQGTISGPLNAAQMPANGTPAIVQGAVLTNLRIWLDKNAVVARYCGCSFVIVESVEYHPKVSEAVQRVTISVKAGGAIFGQSVTITQPV